MSLQTLQDRAADVAASLAELGNAKRLLILCKLSEGECSVGQLQAAVGLSQSALSQHLARLRDAGLVAARREGQMMHYRIADARILQVMQTLCDVYCVEE